MYNKYSAIHNIQQSQNWAKVFKAVLVCFMLSNSKCSAKCPFPLFKTKYTVKLYKEILHTWLTEMFAFDFG